MSLEDFDRFSDEIARQIGSLGGTGYDEFQRVDHQMVQQGIMFQFQCQGCGRSKNMLVEWAELIAMANSVDPAVLARYYPQVISSPISWRWLDLDNAWGPEAICPNCMDTKRRRLSIRLEEHEPARYVRAGINAGLLAVPIYNQINATARKLYEGGLRAR